MQAFLAVIAVVAAGVSSVQVLVARRASHGALMVEMLSKFWDDDSKTARQGLKGLSRKPVSTWSREEIRHAEQVCHQLSLMGFVIKNSYAHKRAFVDYWGIRAVRAYRILEPLVEQRRSQIQAQDQWVDFEWL